MSLKLDPHQEKAAKELKNGSVLRGGVGSGKTRTALYYFYTKVLGGTLRVNGEGRDGVPQRRVDLYVITTAKKRDSKDWEIEAARYAISSDRARSPFGLQIVVDSWNNIDRYTSVRDAFFIFDEQRLVGKGAWVKAYLKIAQGNGWILLSATPGDVWIDYAPVFIANGFYRNRTEFVRKHVVYNSFTKYPKIDRYVETRQLEAHRRAIIVDMPFKRHTVRHIHSRLVGYDKEQSDRVFKDRWHIFDNRPIKDVAELYSVARRLVNSDLSRYNEVMELLEKHPKLIIFYNFNYELEMLRVLASSLNYPVGEWNGHKHEEIPDDHRWIYLVQYTAGAEGWNCTRTDAMVFWSLNYSYRLFEQAMGRIDRMDTPFIDLHYYVLRSQNWVDRAIWAKIKAKKSFNESKSGILWPKAQN